MLKKIRNVIRPYRITCFCLNCFFFLIGGVKKNLFESFAVIFVKENLQKCWLVYKSLVNVKIKSINLNFENCTRYSLIIVGV
jgi:hypothetical protein